MLLRKKHGEGRAHSLLGSNVLTDLWLKHGSSGSIPISLSKYSGQGDLSEEFEKESCKVASAEGNNHILLHLFSLVDSSVAEVNMFLAVISKES